MSEYVTMLENFKDLEVSIIRSTKINKVLKAILKLQTIPREEEFHFKDRSQALLDQWNQLMANEPAAAAANGVNGKSEAKHSEKKRESHSGKEDTEEPKAEESGKPKAEPEATPEAPAALKSEKDEASSLVNLSEEARS